MLKEKDSSIRIAYIFSVSIFVLLAGWWLFNQVKFTPEDSANALFSDSYWILPLIGGIIGLWTAAKWGGLKSAFGKAIFLFALGLLAQVFGQVIYTYYARVQHVEAPYPSIGDIGYFGSVLLYIAGIYLLAKTAGAKLLKFNNLRQIMALGLPALLLLVSYLIFLKDYEFDWSHPINVFLDFGYPFGQAIYVSLALLTFFLSRKLLGGLMKNKVLLLLVALAIQYIADFLFLYRISRGTWYPGGISDVVYLAAYILMTIALIKMAGVAVNINREKAVVENTHNDRLESGSSNG